MLAIWLCPPAADTGSWPLSMSLGTTNEYGGTVPAARSPASGPCPWRQSPEGTAWAAHAMPRKKTAGLCRTTYLAYVLGEVAYTLASCGEQFVSMSSA